MMTKAEFLPFHVINEYMLNDFRKEVVKTVLSRLSSLPVERQKKISGQIRKSVKVSGFRNSSLAPLPLKINGAIETFEKNPAFVSEILGGWCDLHTDLSEKVVALLKARNWEILPIEADRSELPGFLTRWPAKETFDGLITAFREMYPDAEVSENDISLMVVWISNRLPYEIVEEDEENTD